jgi:ferritin-like protein
MGQAGRSIVGAGRARIVKALERAHADEWHAHYNFHVLASTLSGHGAPSVIEALERLSADSFARASRLGRRLSELGGRPPKHLSDLPPQASDKPFRSPDDPRDVEGALRAVADAQATSVRTYFALWKLTRASDPVTAGLATTYLSEAVRDEENIERLTGDDKKTSIIRGRGRSNS